MEEMISLLALTQEVLHKIRSLMSLREKYGAAKRRCRIPIKEATRIRNKAARRTEIGDSCHLGLNLGCPGYTLLESYMFVDNVLT